MDVDDEDIKIVHHWMVGTMSALSLFILQLITEDSIKCYQ